MEPSMRSVDTPLLRIGYEEWNASAQRTVVLLHRLAGLASSADSVVLHAIRHIKLRLFAQGGVPNPRNSGTIAPVRALP